MVRPTVILIATFFLVVSFQNCGSTAPAGGNLAKRPNTTSEVTSDLPIVDVSPIAKADASEPTRVLLEGYFRSGCTGTVEPAIESDGASHVVRAQTTAAAGPGLACSAMIVPFEIEVSLGNLPSGPHVVKYLSDEGPKELVLNVL